MRRLRTRLRFSQGRFADAFGLSVDAVRPWESGRWTPEAAARALLLVIAHDLRLKVVLDERMYRKDTRDINKTNLRLHLLALIAVATGMRRGEIFRLEWGYILYGEGLIAVRGRLKKGKIRLVPMPPELAEEIRRYPAVMEEDRILPPEPGATSGRQCADKSSMNCSREQRFETFDSTICATPLLPGT